MKHNLHNLLFVIVFLLCALFSSAQISDSIVPVHLVRIDYSFSVPMGDMAQRFGVSSGIGFSYLRKTNNNLVYGVEFEYLFGGNVKIEDQLFEAIRTNHGEIIDASGTMALVDTYERGYNLFGTAGKIIPGVGPNPNSGILVTVGAGYLSHHIRTEVFQNSAPQLINEYADGYDRLTGGLAYDLFIGYIRIDNQNIFNFYGGLNFKHALTKPLRNYQFDLMGPEPNDLRNDLFIGVKLGWMLPIYKHSAASYYYY